MKYIYLLVMAVLVFSCNSSTKTNGNAESQNDAITEVEQPAIVTLAGEFLDVHKNYLNNNITIEAGDIEFSNVVLDDKYYLKPIGAKLIRVEKTSKGVYGIFNLKTEGEYGGNKFEVGGFIFADVTDCVDDLKNDYMYHITFSPVKFMDKSDVFNYTGLLLDDVRNFSSIRKIGSEYFVDLGYLLVGDLVVN